MLIRVGVDERCVRLIENLYWKQEAAGKNTSHMRYVDSNISHVPSLREKKVKKGANGKQKDNCSYCKNDNNRQIQ